MPFRQAGQAFRDRIATGQILPLPGVYDVFSAILANRRFEGVFISGFSYAASAYGLPDIGFFNWRDVADFSGRIRHVLPDTHILADIDDGFGDETIAAQTVRQLEGVGVSAVMLEDQKRPRRCGHFSGKEVLPIEEYAVKLRAVLEARRSLFVIARTDATDPLEGLERARRFAELGADAVMVEAVRDLALIRRLADSVPCPVMVNQLHGGVTPDWTLDEMAEAGARIVIYSTPCLFAAQQAVESYLGELARTGRLPDRGTADLAACRATLETVLEKLRGPSIP